MKIAVLFLCLFTIAFAHPLGKSKSSHESEEKHGLRGHHVHKHHHHHSHSHSQEHSHEHVNSHSHESQEHQSSSHLSSESSEEKEEITEQQTLLVPSGKSKEDDLDHSEVDDHDDADDHDDVDDDSHSDSHDSDESDESDQVVTDASIEVSPTPATPGPFTGRGDSPYGLHGGALRKSRTSSEKLDSHDTTEEVDNSSHVDSHESSSSKFPSSESQETEDKSNPQDSNEVHSASHHKSAEDDSHQKLGSVEEDHDDHNDIEY